MNKVAFKMRGEKMDCSINHIGEIAYLFKKKKPPQENLGEYFYNCRITKTFWSKTYKQSHKENIYKFDKIKVFYMANQQTHAIKKKILKENICTAMG